MADERIDVGLFADAGGLIRTLSRVDRSLADTEDSFEGAAGAALEASSAFSIAGRAADEADDEIEDLNRSLGAVPAAAALATTSIAGLGATASGLDLVDALEPGGVERTLRSIPGLTDEASAALSQLDTESISPGEGGTIRYSLAVDRDSLERSLASIDDETIDVNPVLRSLHGQLDTPDVEDVHARAAVATDTTDIRAAATAMAALRSETDDVRTAFASFDDDQDRIDLSLADTSLGAEAGPDRDALAETAAGLRSVGLAAETIDDERVSFPVEATGIASTIAQLEALEAAMGDIDGRTASIDADTPFAALGLGDIDSGADIDTDVDADVGAPPVNVPLIADGMGLGDSIDEIVAGLDVPEIDAPVTVGEATVSQIAAEGLYDTDAFSLRASVETADAYREVGEFADTLEALSAQDVEWDIDTRGIVRAGTLAYELEQRADDLGDEALVAAASLREMGSESSGIVDNALAGAASLSVLQEALDETEDEATAATAAMAGFGAVSLGSGMAAGLGGVASALGGVAGSAGRAQGAISEFVSEGVSGAGQIARAFGPGLARAIPIAAQLSPAALLGAGGVIAALTSTIAGAVSAGIGAGIAGSVIAGGIALPIFLNVDEREKKALIRDLKDAVSVLEGGAWETLQQDLFAGLPQATEDLANLIQSLQPTLLGVADAIGDSFWAEWPALLDELAVSVRRLDDDISAIGIGTLEFLPGLIRETSRAADVLLPIFSGWVGALAPLGGSMSRFGTAIFEFLDAPVQAFLDTLVAFVPLFDLISDTISVAGQALTVFYDAVGAENIEAFGGAIAWTVGLVRLLAESLYNVGDALGVWGRLARGARKLGEIISYAFDRIAIGAQNVVNWIVQAHNTLNDIPGAAALPGISGQDIDAPNVSDISADRGGGPGGPSRRRRQGGDTYITNDVTVEGGGSSATTARRIYEQMERERQRRQSKTLYGSGG